MAAEFERDLRQKDKLPEDEIAKLATRSMQRIIGAPVVIILCLDMSDMDIYPDEKRNSSEYLMAVQSTSNAGMQLLLATHAEGLGAVWVCSPLFAQSTVQNTLELPKSWEPQAMYFLGYPAEIKVEARERKPLEEIVKTFERSNV